MCGGGGLAVDDTGRARVLMARYALWRAGGPAFSECREVEQALARMPARQAAILRVEYLGSGSRHERAKSVGLCRANYYHLLGAALDTLQAILRLP